MDIKVDLYNCLVFFIKHQNNRYHTVHATAVGEKQSHAAA